MEKQTASIKVYTMKDLEQILGVSNKTLLKYAQTGKLKCVKIGREWRISEENLQKFINGEE
jgi:excisionase family DNA binding protein